MTLKVVITLIPLLFNVAFHVDKKIWVENMHILADMRPQVSIKGRLISLPAQSLSLFGWWQGRGGLSMPRGWGSKIGDILFEWPYTSVF